MRPRILIFCDFYLPGFKSGGGMWMIANLVERFADKYDFFIVTRNFDSKGDRRPYATVVTNDWNNVGPARVFYFGKGSLSVAKAAQIVAFVRPDAVYLNSALSLPVRQFLRARRRGLGADMPVILAPCGEMSEGALSIKPLKKKAFLTLALAAGLYRDVIWKASFDAEAGEVRRVIGPSAKVLVAPDLAPKAILPDFEESRKPDKTPGHVRFAFFSRIVPKKNLKYLIECISEVREGRVDLDIIGPQEDTAYWSECRTLIDRLPQNVTVTIGGSFPVQTDALRRLAESHFFAMPTLNENFGYVFVEALAAGCPLLISDRTAWSDVEEKGVGWRVPLEDRNLFISRIKECLAMDAAAYREMSRKARRYALDWLSLENTEIANAHVLQYALSLAHRHDHVSASRV
jgi:glycosyltransferase involved in cell wall biosynthesis